MIEDFDGPDPVPSRRGHMLVVSALLLAGVIAGYAAVSSPELRGPYATPRPSVVNGLRFTPAPVASLDPAAIEVPFTPCVPPPGVQLPMVFNGITSYTYELRGQSVILHAFVGAPCSPVIWGQPPSPMAYDRVSR